MPRSVYKAPFHRRIMPWIFVGIFVIVAPILIFYTSGYRINSKKISIERDGTLIADSLPTGAHIILNGNDTGRATPSTIQNISPGPYLVRYELGGMLPWEKTLDIRPEQVTFADKIRLWKDAPVGFASPEQVIAMQVTDDGSRLAAIVRDQTGIDAAVLDADGSIQQTLKLDGLSATYTPRLVWNANNTAFLIDYNKGEGNDGWLNTGNGHIGSLPQADYVWEGTTLTGTDGTTRFAADPRSGSLTRTKLPAGMAAEMDAFDLLVSTSTGDMSVRPHSILRRLYSLPAGTWSVTESAGTYAILKNETHWLAVKRNGDPLQDGAEGDVPRWNFAGKEPRALLLNGNEAWLWTPGASPTLLMRQSDPFTHGAWHRDGYHVFLATKDKVFVLELDDRSGHNVNDLTTGFEKIQDIAVAGTSLFISGTKGTETGLFKRVIE